MEALQTSAIAKVFTEAIGKEISQLQGARDLSLIRDDFCFRWSEESMVWLYNSTNLALSFGGPLGRLIGSTSDYWH